MRLATLAVFLVLLVGCTHSDGFDYAPPAVAAPTPGADVRLTFNSEQDYWPMWTADGRGILYSFVDPGATSQHRCIGLLPAAGGPRIWQLCDNRATQSDTVSSFSGFALDAGGQLLYAEGAANNRQLTPIPRTTLWLADTARPFARTALLTLPVSLGSATVTWLGEIHWAGATSFVALGQLFETFEHCLPNGANFCSQQDTLFFGSGSVVAGTIAGTHATLQAITGTDGATGFSPAENGSSIVFTRAHDSRLWKVAAAGGTPVVVATIAPGTAAELLGVSCQANTCVVASAPVTLTAPSVPDVPRLGSGITRLDAVSISTGLVQTLQSNTILPQNPPSQIIFSTPELSSVNGDVVVQRGGTWWGHLQTFFGGGNSDLHLYAGIVH